MYLLFLLRLLFAARYEISLDKKKLDIYSDSNTGNSVTKDEVASKASSDLLEVCIVHSGITELQDSAFSYFSKIVSVKLPNGLKYLRKFCFRGCSALKSIELPYGLVQIFNQVFSGCISLEVVTFSSTVEILDPTMFEFCQSIAYYNFSEPNPIYSTDPTGRVLIANGKIAVFGTAAYHKVKIPDQIKTISKYFLSTFKNVTEIDFGSAKNLTRIESQAFRRTNISRIEYPEGLEYVGDIVLEAIDVEFISVPSTLKSHDGIFSPPPKEVYIHPQCQCFFVDENKVVYNSMKTEIDLVPNGIGSINISSIVKKVNVKSITACKTLKYLMVDPENMEFSDYKNVLYSKSKSNMIACPGGIGVIEVCPLCSNILQNSLCDIEADELKFELPRSVDLNLYSITLTGLRVKKEIVFPDGLKTIHNWAMAAVCAPSISFPNSLQYILYESMAVIKTRKLDFSNCDKITTIENGAFKESEIEEIILPPCLESIDIDAVKSCHNLKSVEIPSTVLSIGDSCFYNCTSLSSLKFLCANIESIGSSSFKLCNLESVEVPANLETLPMEMFSSNPNLREIIFPSESNITEIQLGVFKDCDKIESIHLPSNLRTFAGGALYGMGGLQNITIDENPLFECDDGVLYTKGLEELVAFPGGRRKYVIHKGVKAFRESAFFMCKRLEEVTYEGEVALDTIGAQTFLGCERFAAIMIPGKVSSIAALSFSGCTKLTNVSFGEESLITKIVSTTFDGCERLERVRFESFSHLEEIEEGVFAGLTRLRVFEVPPSLRKIGRGAFRGCSGLESFRFFNLTEIEEGSFEGCSSLREISLGPNLTVLGNRSFGSCSGLVTISYCGFNLFASDAFPTNNRLLSVRVPLNYSSEKIGGIPAMRALDSDCHMATVVFTAVEGTKALLLLWSTAALNGSED